MSRQNASRFKTQLCMHWQERGVCEFGTRCLFAHGESDRRPVVPNAPGSGSSSRNAPDQDRSRPPRPVLYRTKLCQVWERTGACPLGPTCRFAHGSDELVRRVRSRRRGADKGPNAADSGSDEVVLDASGVPVFGSGGAFQYPIKPQLPHSGHSQQVPYSVQFVRGTGMAGAPPGAALMAPPGAALMAPPAAPSQGHASTQQYPHQQMPPALAVGHMSATAAAAMMKQRAPGQLSPLEMQQLQLQLLSMQQQQQQQQHQQRQSSPPLGPGNYARPGPDDYSASGISSGGGGGGGSSGGHVASDKHTNGVAGQHAPFLLASSYGGVADPEHPSYPVGAGAGRGPAGGGVAATSAPAPPGLGPEAAVRRGVETGAAMYLMINKARVQDLRRYIGAYEHACRLFESENCPEGVVKCRAELGDCRMQLAQMLAHDEDYQEVFELYEAALHDMSQAQNPEEDEYANLLDDGTGPRQDWHTGEVISGVLERAQSLSRLLQQNLARLDGTLSALPHDSAASEPWGLEHATSLPTRDRHREGTSSDRSDLIRRSSALRQLLEDIRSCDRSMLLFSDE